MYQEIIEVVAYLVLKKSQSYEGGIMARICDLEQASIALVAAQKERKIGKITIRMDYTSTPGTVICNLKDSVGSISIKGATEIKGLINELERLLGEN